MEGMGRGDTHVSGVVGELLGGWLSPSPISCKVQPSCIPLSTPALRHQIFLSGHCRGTWSPTCPRAGKQEFLTSWPPA